MINNAYHFHSPKHLKFIFFESSHPKFQTYSKELYPAPVFIKEEDMTDENENRTRTVSLFFHHCLSTLIFTKFIFSFKFEVKHEFILLTLPGGPGKPRSPLSP